MGKNLPEKPLSYGHIYKRINRLNININITNYNTCDDGDDEYIIIAIYGTGIKIINRGQCLSEKWNVKNRKGYVKIQAVNKGQNASMGPC